MLTSFQAALHGPPSPTKYDQSWESIASERAATGDLL